VYHRNNKHSRDKIININMAEAVVIKYGRTQQYLATEKHLNADNKFGSPRSQASVDAEVKLDKDEWRVRLIKAKIKNGKKLSNAEKAFMWDYLVNGAERNIAGDKRNADYLRISTK
jgi:hypothetical protein